MAGFFANRSQSAGFTIDFGQIVAIIWPVCDTPLNSPAMPNIKVPLNELKDHLSEYVTRASKEQVVITKHGRPAAVIIGFADEDDWFEYRLLNDRRFKARMAESRRQAVAGQTIKLEDLPD